MWLHSESSFLGTCTLGGSRNWVSGARRRALDSFPGSQLLFGSALLLLALGEVNQWMGELCLSEFQINIIKIKKNA